MKFEYKHPYQPSFMFKNAHLNTMYPFFFRTPFELKWQRERISTPDKDFFDIDKLNQNSDKVILLFHGLEGSSDSKYIGATASLFFENGYDIIAMNYRSCSGETNNNIYSYHSGKTDDVHLLVKKINLNYNNISLVGFSLGGNLVLKYLSDGVYDTSNINVGVAVSCPVDLKGAAIELGKLKNRHYEYKFLRSLIPKALNKSKKFKSFKNIDKIKSIKNIIEFDHYFTGPINGFKDAIDYYDQCNSLKTLENIKTPALLLNAKDDPFLSDSCYPEYIQQQNLYLSVLTVPYGGHLGFSALNQKYYWNERTILQFVQENN